MTGRSIDEIVVGDFQEFMEAIDAEFARRNVPIPTRDFDAYWVALQRCGMSAGTPTTLERRLGLDSVTLHDAVSEWMERRYGARRCVHLGPGSTLILLRGAVWRIRIPLFYGTSRVVALRPDETSNTRVLNAVDYLVDAPDAFRRSLSGEECMRIQRCFVRSAALLLDLHDASDVGLLGPAHADLQAAAEHLLSDPPEIALSRWSSLQATEKGLKQLIKERGGKARNTHSLKILATAAECLGLPRLDPAVLSQAQCWPGIRYGQDAGSIERGVDALEGAYSTIASVLHALRLGRGTPGRDEECLSGPIDWRAKFTGEGPQ